MFGTGILLMLRITNYTNNEVYYATQSTTITSTLFELFKCYSNGATCTTLR